MHPTIGIPFTDLVVSSQLVALVTAVAIGLVLGPPWIARLEGLDRATIRRAQILLGTLPFVTGRLHFLLNYPGFFRDHPLRAFVPWGGALHMSGALMGLVIGVPLVARYYRIPLAKLGDGLVPVVALAIVAMRIGCLLHGCCFGTECHYPWCIAYPAGSLPYLMHQQAGLIGAGATHSLWVHPEPVYFLLSCVLTIVVALAVNRRKRFDGQVVWSGMLVLFGTSAVLETFRAPELQPTVWFGVPQLTLTELALAAIGLIGLLVGTARVRRTRPVGPSVAAQGAEVSC